MAGTPSRRGILTAVVAGTAAPAVAASASAPDAALIALCNQAVTWDAEWRVLVNGPDSPAADRAARRLVRDLDGLRTVIARLPATGASGLRAKLRAALLDIERDSRGDPIREEEAAILSALQDAQRLIV